MIRWGYVLGGWRIKGQGMMYGLQDPEKEHDKAQWKMYLGWVNFKERGEKCQKKGDTDPEEGGGDKRNAKNKQNPR